MSEYIIVAARDLGLLTEYVNQKLAEGWSLQGGVSMGPDRSTPQYLQAMAR
jgi:hypothetical protein